MANIEQDSNLKRKMTDLEQHHGFSAVAWITTPQVTLLCGKAAAVIAVALTVTSLLAETATGQSWPQISFSKPIAGFTHPTHVASSFDASGRLFVVEQAGRIRIIKNGVLQSTPFLDITAKVGSTSGTKGLLSVAFPPGFAAKQHFYVNYTTPGGDIIIARYSVTSNPDVADPNSEQIVLMDGPFPDHYGGELSFSPLDGFLYFGIGTGSGSSPDSLGQDVSVLRGKLLRIDVETGNPSTYTIPATNPYVGNPNARHEIWALGLRNPWRSSFDKATGDYYIADVGQAAREEVDFQSSDNAGGANYGWDVMEGSICFGATTCDTTGLTLPVTEYDHSQGCAISGGTVYRGTLYPAFDGIYFFGDWCSGELWGLQQINSSWQSSLLYETTLSIISFCQDQSGEFWVADYSGGAIYPIKPGAPTPIDLSLTQNDSPDPCPAGGQLTYIVNLLNSGSSLATGIVLTDTMPAGTLFTSVKSSTGTCSRSGGTITCRIPSLASGSSATITLVVQPQAAGTISNAANVVANEPDTNLADNSSSESTSVSAATDMKITVTDGKSSVPAGSQDTYTVIVTNSGPLDVTGASVTDVFPASFTGVTFTGTQTGGASGFTASGSGNIRETVNMPAGSKITYKAKGKISQNATGTLTNTATVGLPTGFSDPNTANNGATDSDAITFKADLKITITDGKTTAVAGTKNTYTIVATNLGPSNATGATIQDTFPATLANVTFTATQSGGATGFSSSGSGSINDTVDMPAASRIIYKATGTVSASATGSIVDTATVAPSSGVPDPNTGNNTATDTDTL